MNQAEKAQAFAALHIPGKPVILYNIRDAGSARTVAKAGAPAVATGSWSVAAAQGYSDGQAIPLKERDADRRKSLVQNAVERASAYADAGASGFFVPGLTDPDLVGKICADVSLPVNVMMAPKAPSIGVLSDCGVARVSFGGWPYMDAAAALTERFDERTGMGPQ